MEEFISSAQRKLCYEPDTAVVVVLEEDGTEVDEDDYFQTLDPNTCLMLLHAGDRWSPFSAAASGMSYFCQSVAISLKFHFPNFPTASVSSIHSRTAQSQLQLTFQHYIFILAGLSRVSRTFL